MFSVIKLASESLTEKYSPNIFNYFHETFPEGFIIAEKYHKIIGFILGVPLDDKTTKILMIVVSNEHRRQGIGTKLLQRFIKKISLTNIQNIELEVRIDNTNAIKFYRKNNFQVTDQLSHFYQDGQSAYIMKKNI